jgi:hypothetical protein
MVVPLKAARDPVIIPPGRAAVGAFLLAPVGAKWLAGGEKHFHC